MVNTSQARITITIHPIRGVRRPSGSICPQLSVEQKASENGGMLLMSLRSGQCGGGSDGENGVAAARVMLCYHTAGGAVLQQVEKRGGSRNPPHMSWSATANRQDMRQRNGRWGQREGRITNITAQVVMLSRRVGGNSRRHRPRQPVAFHA